MLAILMTYVAFPIDNDPVAKPEDDSFYYLVLENCSHSFIKVCGPHEWYSPCQYRVPIEVYRVSPLGCLSQDEWVGGWDSTI